MRKLVMRNFIAKLVVGLFAFTLLTSPRLAMAQSTGAGDSSEIGGGLGTGDFQDAANESTGLTATLRSVAKYALYVFYLLGVIFMGVAAIKFKNGDMEAMGKNLGGAVCLFLVPKIVEVILAWAAQ
jgi:hypothetical protein